VHVRGGRHGGHPVAQGRGQIGIRIIGTQSVLVPWLVASLADFPPFVRKFRLYIDTLRSYNGYSYKGYLVEYLGTRQPASRR